MPSSAAGAQPQPSSERDPGQTTPMTVIKGEATLITSPALSRQKKITVLRGEERKLEHREVKRSHKGTAGDP